MPPRSSYPSNDNKRSIEAIAEKPGIIRKNHISETKKKSQQEVNVKNLQKNAERKENPFVKNKLYYLSNIII